MPHLMIEFLHDEVVWMPLDGVMRLVKDEKRDLAHLQLCDSKLGENSITCLPRARVLSYSQCTCCHHH